MPSKEFTYTGSWARWDVPKKVEWVDVVLEGAGSGSSPGGRVTGRIRVKEIRTLLIQVPEKGAKGGGPTFGGGGPAGHGRDRSDGWSGGGAAVIRSTSVTGAVKAVAGGAGGASGDGGSGGAGGGDVGGLGLRADLITTDPPPLSGDIVDVASATGGTQIQGGEGGASSAAADLAGFDAGDAVLAVGGAGGGPGQPGTYGGGGGGGGYHGGGGGAAGWAGQSPGGGGGGGSSYAVALTQFTNSIGGGSMGNGRVTLTWVTPPPANQPPSAPTDLKVGSDDYLAEMPTFSTGEVDITATLKDSTSSTVRLVVQYAPDSSFTGLKTIRSKFVDKGKKATVHLTGLAQNTLWYLRLYAEDKQGLLSTSYTAVRFWTNRAPNAPTLLLPGENDVIDDLDPVNFGWSHTDPDHPESPHQSAFNLEWRRSSTPLFPAGPWQSVTFETQDETYIGPSEDFKASTSYDWHVRTRDEQKLWGPMSEIRSFFVRGSSAPPWLLGPTNREAVDITDGATLLWLFRDPVLSAVQVSADLRYRLAGTTDWLVLLGDVTYPGAEASWFLGPGTLVPGLYEWQVRTYSDVTSEPSDWSDSGFFHAIRTPGIVTGPVVIPTRTVEARLGCGVNEVHVYRRGGQMYVGQIKPVQNLTYNRKRDDISNCTFTVNGPGYDCASLLREIHCWTHEIVIWRDGKRVWEGPISRIEDDQSGGVFIEARDVWNYLYRRIMRQGYNDVYQIVGGVQVGMQRVTTRGRQIALNALAPDDPNVLPYFTTLNFPDDALQSRAVPDFAKTAWEEIDSLAATGGLDYTAVGRRCLLWDTHRPLGRLPELRAEHFSSPPVISEYGMLLATDYGVTNNNGLFGLATRRDPGTVPAYGIVELLSSAYGESEADSSGSADTLTSEAQAALEVALAEQAERNIAHRYPTPMIVRVPDNSTLNPETPVAFDHLVPGVWVPLRAKGAVRSIAQWQKLDVVTVTDAPSGEQISVVFSAAPNAGEDPDAGIGVDAGSEAEAAV